MKNDYLTTGMSHWMSASLKSLTSASFGISKFPVIKAIERLSLEKIVTIVPNKGTFVVPPDAGMVHEVSQIRNMIEEYALSYALDNTKDELIREINEVQSQWDFTGKPFEEIDRIDFLRYDRHFHLAIVKCTNNEQLVSYYRTIRSQIQLFRARTFKYSSVESAIAMHDEIVRAIENNGDRKAVIKYVSVGCLINNLIIFNPDKIMNESVFKVLLTSRELGFDQQPGPQRLIANAPVEFIRRAIFNTTK